MAAMAALHYTLVTSSCKGFPYKVQRLSSPKCRYLCFSNNALSLCLPLFYEDTSLPRRRRRRRTHCNGTQEEEEGFGTLAQDSVEETEFEGSNGSASFRSSATAISEEEVGRADEGRTLSSSSSSTTNFEGSSNNPASKSSIEAVTLAVKEPVYQVLEVNTTGSAVTKTISRRQLLKSSGLRLRDIRSVDPSLRVTNSMPSLLIRDQAILLNLGSLRAIARPHNVLVFDHNSIGGQAFLELLLQRMNPETNGGAPSMPFELEVVESALLSRTQRLERRLMEIEPRVQALLEVLPNCLTANVLEELRVSKQALVELVSKANALRQMLLELLDDPYEIRRITVMGRQCTLHKDDGSVECLTLVDKQSADDEEEEIEMLLENYLQRCESCHAQAERLLDSAKEMEDSLAVSLRRYCCSDMPRKSADGGQEIRTVPRIYSPTSRPPFKAARSSRLELLLQVGTFCSALGALVAGIFGMNLKSYLEDRVLAFWIATAGIILGGIVLFFVMYNHLKRRKIL